MRPTTHVAASRLAGALIGTLLLAVLLAAPPATAAAPDEPQSALPTAGLLARGAGYDEPDGSARVRALQLRLRSAGEAPGPVDGLFGPLTEAAVRRFQTREGLAVDGVVGPHTQTALRQMAALLRPGAGYGSPRGSAAVRKLQRGLRAADERPGPIDGRFGPLTEDAVRRFQSHEGLLVDGIVGKATRAALGRHLTQIRSPRPERRPGHQPKGESKARKPMRSPGAAPAGNPPSDEGVETPVIAALVLAGVLLLVAGAPTALNLWRRARRPEARVAAERRRAAASKPPAQGPVEERAPASDSRGSKAAPIGARSERNGRDRSASGEG